MEEEERRWRKVEGEGGGEPRWREGEPRSTVSFSLCVTSLAASPSSLTSLSCPPSSDVVSGGL